jgi:hypothetical protein
MEWIEKSLGCEWLLWWTQPVYNSQYWIPPVGFFAEPVKHLLVE